MYRFPHENVFSGRKSLEEENADIRRYMRDREVFFSDYKKYLEDIGEYRGKFIFTIEMQIINNGSAPAESVDLYVHFPDGFQMFSAENLPQIPKPPPEPVFPRDAKELIAAKLKVPSLNDISALTEICRNTPNIASPTFTLKKTHSYEFEESFELIKHGGHIKTNAEMLYIVFDSIDKITNFSAEYVVSGSNIPVVISGTLSFIFNIEHAV